MEGRRKKMQENIWELGSPTLEDIGDGRFKCVETRHKMGFKDIESYQQSKHNKLALIDAAMANKKLPFFMFKQHPHCKTKLICKLTGDTVNKSEEHIQKHINGSQFLPKLDETDEDEITTPYVFSRKEKEHAH